MPKLLFRSALGGVLPGALGPAGAALAGPSGAAFTADADGTAHRTHAADGTDVLPNGGPCNAAPASARLRDGRHAHSRGQGDASPPGPAEDRLVRVPDGVIAASSDPVDRPPLQAPCGPVVRVGPVRAASRSGTYPFWVAPRGARGARRSSTADSIRADGNCRRAPPPAAGSTPPPRPPATDPPTPPPGPEL
jgi:hypothetical protein